VSIAAVQYDKFREQAVREERVFTFTEGGEFLVYPVHAGETIPFWSSRSRLETIQKRTPKYQRYQIAEIPLTEFYALLDRLAREDIQVGVNWSGARLTGYNFPVTQLRDALDYWVDRLEKRHNFPRRA